MRLLTYTFLAVFVSGCSFADRMSNFFEWIVNHPGAFIGIMAAIIPLVALIPGVGGVLAATLTKILVTLSPVLRELSEAYQGKANTEFDEQRIAEKLEKEIVDHPGTKIGTVPGTKVVARIVARRLAKKSRKRK